MYLLSIFTVGTYLLKFFLFRSTQLLSSGPDGGRDSTTAPTCNTFAMWTKRNPYASGKIIFQQSDSAFSRPKSYCRLVMERFRVRNSRNRIFNFFTNTNSLDDPWYTLTSSSCASDQSSHCHISGTYPRVGLKSFEMWYYGEDFIIKFLIPRSGLHTSHAYKGTNL